MAITFEEITDGNIECCRELCNELMLFQQSKATIAPEVFDMMNFDTRMKHSYDSTSPMDRQVIVMKDDGTPVGYVFSTIEDVSEGDKSEIPPWVPTVPGTNRSEYLGFYPVRENFPKRVGCLNNLYLKDGYKGGGNGKRLYDMTMEWMKGFPDIDYVYVYISNGNERALKFYYDRGFTYSHDVFGGFITAAYYKFEK